MNVTLLMALVAAGASVLTVLINRGVDWLLSRGKIQAAVVISAAQADRIRDELNANALARAKAMQEGFEQQVDLLSKQRDQDHTEVVSLRVLADSNQAEIVKLEAQNAEQQETINSLAAERADLKRTITGLRAENVALAKASDDQQNQINASSRVIKEHEGRIYALVRRLRAYEDTSEDAPPDAGKGAA